MAITAVIVAVVAAVAGAVVAVLGARRRAGEQLAAARAEVAGMKRSAQLAAASARRAAETEAREASLELRARFDEEQTRSVEELARREERIEEEEVAFEDERRVLDGKWAAFKERKKVIQSQRDRAKSIFANADEALSQMRDRLAERAGITAEQLSNRMAHAWVEDARAAAANRLRSLDASAADPEIDRAARRVMEIASSRYKNHFLTERLISNITLQAGVGELLLADDSAILHAIQNVANIQLLMSDDGDAVRLEGLDGVGREIARRALSRLAKPKHRQDIGTDPTAWVEKIKESLQREIVNLGRKAFSVLEVPRAHPEIVDLVGRLNFRTSYTQNQWLHAVEASFIAGMMADELGLDVGLTRRACRMHDIGKSLTHEIEGSHAVIGADIARRLGEDEVIANAIGSHHADEPPSSVYAFLVAAGDAMSGARPGARRMMTTEYGNRIEDLERIGASYKGVERAYAVHGGRELRVYIREGQLDDAEVVQLSTTIATRIGEEMTFPGQIKVTVIRAYEAVSVAN